MDKNDTDTKLYKKKIRTVRLNWIAWNIIIFLQLNCVLMLNWIVSNRTVYLYKNIFGVKKPTKVDML